MPSTVIRRFDYRAGSRELIVEFVTGRVYVYSDVPEVAAQRLRGAYSKGRHFNQHIRDKYRCREVSAPASDFP